jgi:hypothetical protein
MSRELGPEWSPSSSAFCGCLVGLAGTALHQLYSAISNNIPDDIYTHVISEMIVGALGGGTLFVIIATIRNRLTRWR